MNKLYKHKETRKMRPKIKKTAKMRDILKQLDFYLPKGKTIKRKGKRATKAVNDFLADLDDADMDKWARDANGQLIVPEKYQSKNMGHDKAYVPDEDDEDDEDFEYDDEDEE